MDYKIKRISIDNFKKLLDMHIKNLVNQIKEQEEVINKIINYNIDPKAKDIHEFLNLQKALTEPTEFGYYEGSLHENYILLKNYQELNELISSNPEFKSITIDLSKQISSQIEDILKQVDKDPDAKFREKIVASIKKKLELPPNKDEIASQNNNNLLYFNSEIKPDINPTGPTKTGPIIINLQEFEDIASIKDNSLYNDLYGDEGINSRISKLYKETTTRRFEKALAKIEEIEKITNDLKKGNCYLEKFNLAVKADLKKIASNKLELSNHHLKALPKDKYPKFYTRFKKMLDTKNTLENEYKTWKNIRDTFKQLPPDKKANIQVSYDPGLPVEIQMLFFKKNIEGQLGKPLKEFSISNSPKTPGGGPDFR